MTRVEEIAQAMRTRPEPMFLFGLIALARYDYLSLRVDMIAANQSVQAEKIAQVKMESR